ncbi:hypothetical protein OHA02_36620 [Streptomyces phaeochromogenes]|nr:hypothetical protein [Streptomyces phaeochromogenes]
MSLASGCVTVLSTLWALSWSEPLIGSGGKRLSVVGIITLLVALATALWTLGVIAAGARRARLWLSAVALTSMGVAASVHAGALGTTQSLGLLLADYPSVNFKIAIVPLWALVVASASMVAAASVLLVPLARIAAHPVRYGLIVSVPAWAVLLIWAFLSHDPNPVPSALRLSKAGTERYGAPSSATSLALLNDYLSLALVGAVFFVSLLAAVEVSDANVATAKQAARWRPHQARGMLIAFLLAKVAFLCFGFAGVFGGRQAAEVWDHGFWGQWVVSAVLVALGCVVYVRAHARPLVAGHLRPITVLLVIGFGLDGLIIMTLPYLQATSVAFLPVRWQAAAVDVALGPVLFVDRYGPLCTIAVAGVVGLVLLVTGQRTDGAVLAVSAFVVGLPLAVQILDAPIGRALVSLPILDVTVTVAVLLALGIAKVRPSRALPAHELLVVLVASGLLAFAVDAFLSEAVQRRFFPLVLLAPVVWRFAVDTRDERRRPPSHTVLSMVGWSVVLAMSGLALALGIKHDLWSVEDRFDWRLIVVPLAFVLLCRRVSLPEPVSPGWRGTPEQSASWGEPRWAYALGALVSLALVCCAGSAFSRSIAVPQVERADHRVSTPLPEDWAPMQCKRTGDAEVLVLAAPPDSPAYVIAGYGTKEAVWATLRNCKEGDDQELLLKGPLCAHPELASGRTLSVAGMPGAEIRAGSNIVRCAHRLTGTGEKFLIAKDVQDKSGGLRKEVVAVIDGIVFEDRRR